jgi:hypothetical protein
MSILAPAMSLTGQGCRVWERYQLDLQTACQPVATRNDRDLVWAATIRDISVGGVGIVMPRRFEPGMGLAIELPPKADGTSDTLLARVAHVRRLPEGGWLLGCTFISQLSEQELEDLVHLSDVHQEPASAAEPAPAGEDAAPAHRKTVVVESIIFQSEPQNGRVARLKVNRLVVTGSWPPVPGTELRVKFPDAGGDSSANKIRVIRAVEKDGRWTVTYQFVSAPSVRFRLLFGYTSAYVPPKAQG